MNRLMRLACAVSIAAFGLSFLTEAALGAGAASVSLDAHPISGPLFKSLGSPVELDVKAGISPDPESGTYAVLSSMVVSMPEFDFEPDQGLPACNPSSATSKSSALAQCGPALVGSGSATLVFIDGSATTTLDALFFNGGKQGADTSVAGLAFMPGFPAPFHIGIAEDGNDLKINLPTIGGGIGWKDIELKLPGSQVTNSDERGRDPKFVRASCSTGVWSTDAQLSTSEGLLTTTDSDSCIGAADPTLGLTVDKSGAGEGIITSVPSGIECGAICSFQFSQDSVVELKAAPTNRSVFGGWTGPCEGSGDSCEVTMSEARRIGATFDVKAPSGPVGVSVNDGDQFTNDAEVSLAVTWVQGAKKATISNDGGFQISGTFDLEKHLSWTLDSSGPERLPKTVYLRFDDSNQTFADDIILDETAPTLSSATASETGGSSSSTRSIASASGGHKVKLKTKASDRTSGVALIQAGPKKSTKLKKIKYRRSVTVSSSGKKLWVRVLDRAGNASKWKKVKVK